VYCTDIDQDFDPSASADKKFDRQCIKQYDEIKSNFFIANYASSMAIDNDDGRWHA
jgi:hypothetical protein